MSKRYVQVPIKYLEPIFHSWNEAYLKGDLVNVFFLPYGDLLFRALQFVDWMRAQTDREIRLINFETDLIASPEDLEEELENSGETLLVLVVKRSFMRPDAQGMAGVLEKWYARYGQGIVVLHEGFPSELGRYLHYPVMQQRQLIHSIYPTPVALEYTQNTAKLFGVEASVELMNAIVARCGGIPWLINDVLRRTPSDNLFDDTVLLWKVAQIADAIPIDLDIKKELQLFGLKDEKGKWVPIFEEYFDRLAQNKLDVGIDRILYDSHDFTKEFSSGEMRILHHLHSHEGLVRREELGQLFWQDKVDEEYSDWALDAIMSRLRKKITKLYLPIEIKTRRGRGYECI